MLTDNYAEVVALDNEAADLRGLSLESKSEVEGVVDYSLLEDEAVSAQRLAVSRLSDVYVPGMMLVSQVAEGKKTTVEKRFHLSKLVTWDSGEPDILINELNAGRVRCRLSARMGLGKSTRLPFIMANRTESRVLHVTLSAHTLQQTSDYVVARGIGTYRTIWSAVKKPWVTCMTYADFNGHMASPDRSTLFRSFDVIYMDEGFVETVDVMVAKRFLAVYALPDTSIVVASATISNDEIDGSGGAAALGNFMKVDKNKSVDEVIADPRFTSDWIVDRTAIFCPSNEAIEHVRRVLHDDAVDVRILDDAASADDERKVSEWLQGDGSTFRVVVMHVRYGIGYNFPISYALIFPYESKLVISKDSIHNELVPLTEKMVEQMKSRTGRRIAEGSGGIIFSSERADVQVLSPADKIIAFVKLTAGYIEPMKSDYWSVAYEVFPMGLTAGVAMQLLKVNLHPRITAKYLAPDGLFASKYVRALTIYSQPDHYLLPSRYEQPNGCQDWPLQTLIGSSGDIRVPMLADGEIRVILQAITAISQGDITVERWRPKETFIMHDGYDSDDGGREVATRSRLRRIVDKELPQAPVRPTLEIPWSYHQGEPADVRRGGILDRDRMRDALRQWDDALLNYEVPLTASPEIVHGFIEDVVLSTDQAVVESPNGSRICEIPMSICKKLNEGRMLSANEFVELIRTVRGTDLAFAQSKVFDMFAKPWDSFLGSLTRRDVVSSIARNGLGTDTYQIVDYLRARLNTEVSAIVASSNVFRGAYKTLFRKQPSMDVIMRKVRDGKFDTIAQTRGFIDRTKELKELVDRVLVFAETEGMYLPSMITSAQRGVALRGNNLLGYVGDDLKPMPKDWGNIITTRAPHTRSSSKSSFLK